jgi:hypothetical protein
MADEREKGWAPWEPAQDRSDSGVGAFTGGRHPDGPGHHGIAEGHKGEARPSTGAGAPQPEFPPEGWGEEGENYPPTQGPLGDPDERGPG